MGLGSPPPMRGKAGQPSKRIDGAGITPAYAGKSYNSVADTYHPQDHPRLCGEKRLQKQLLYNYQGSPPPMRGKDLSATISRQENRITPAYAGKRTGKF